MIGSIHAFVKCIILFAVSSFFGIARAYADYHSHEANDFGIEDDFSPEYKDQLLHDALGSRPKKPDPIFVTYLEDIRGRLVLEQMHDGAVADLVLAVRNENMWNENNFLRRKLISLLNRAGSYARKHGSVQQIKQVDDLVHESFALWPAGPDKASVAHLVNDVDKFAQKQQAQVCKELERELEEQEKETEKKRKELLAEAEKVAKDAEREVQAPKSCNYKKNKSTKQRFSRAKKSDEEKETKLVKSHPLDRPAARGRKKIVAEPAAVEFVAPEVKAPVDPVPQFLPAYGFTPEEPVPADLPIQEENTVAHGAAYEKTKGSVCV